MQIATNEPNEPRPVACDTEPFDTLLPHCQELANKMNTAVRRAD